MCVFMQLHKNGKADGMIKDLYVENTQLLQALQLSEQRHKTAEKKNFLLEEKISSLNKIVRELGPSPLSPTPYHFTRSWPILAKVLAQDNQSQVTCEASKGRTLFALIGWDAGFDTPAHLKKMKDTTLFVCCCMQLWMYWTAFP